jgi:hypothetical protein
MQLDELREPLVLDFLDEPEIERHSSVSTLKARLAAIHALRSRAAKLR